MAGVRAPGHLTQANHSVTQSGQKPVTELGQRQHREEDVRNLEASVNEVFKSEPDRQKALIKIAAKRGFSRTLTPAEKGEILSIPQLCLDFGDGHIILAERESFLPSGWNILDYPVALDSFRVSREDHVYEIDLYGAKLVERVVSTQETLSFNDATHWTNVQLVDWLDRRLHQTDITPSMMTEFLRRYINYLQRHIGVAFSDLVKMRYILEKLIREKITSLREEAFRKGFQDVLFDHPETALVGPEASFVFREGLYPAKSFYSGSFQFSKHFFPVIGAMNDEEIQCAMAIERCSQVRTWVRNIERQEHYSFWLPTHQDRFYPDFVADLRDGRILVIEYKGGHLMTGDDTEEKTLIGQLWAKRSNGRCVFLMAGKRDSAGRDLDEQIENIILKQT